MNKIHLIIPIGVDKEEYKNRMPYIFNLAPDGISFCIKSILGLGLDRFTNIYFTILKTHDKQYSLSLILRLQFRKMGWKNAKIVVLENPTLNQAETVYQTIKKESITGALFIKDSDGFFSCDFTIENGIAIYPLDKLDIVSPGNKSYVEVDDQFYITNIIEKKIISRYFNAGGYLFESTELFCSYFEKLQSYKQLYMSHLVYAMLLDKVSFRPFEVKDYQDWGTDKLYKLYAFNQI